MTTETAAFQVGDRVRRVGQRRIAVVEHVYGRKTYFKQEGDEPQSWVERGMIRIAYVKPADGAKRETFYALPGDLRRVSLLRAAA